MHNNFNNSHMQLCYINFSEKLLNYFKSHMFMNYLYKFQIMMFLVKLVMVNYVYFRAVAIRFWNIS